MSEQLPELALTDEEVDEVLRVCNGRAVLVGGQSLAFWAQHYSIPVTGALAACVTSDVDFIGTADVARVLAESLRPLGWRYWQPTIDDATPHTAKLSKRVEGRGIKQIDFLSAIVGLDAERVMKRAPIVRLAEGTQVRVLHPLDVLESRLWNVCLLPSKRSAEDLAQVILAINVAGGYFEQLLREHSTRQFLDSAERVGSIAQNARLGAVLSRYGFDVLRAVPADRAPSKAFQTMRWPQIVRAAEQRRASYSRE